MTAAPGEREALKKKGDLEIQDVSAWVLRVGVIVSVLVMLVGLAASFHQGWPTVGRMETLRFSTDYLGILKQAARFDGVALIELGIFLLVLTPIMRVASSMIIFATHERDWFYAGVTLAVLALTLISLLILS